MHQSAELTTESIHSNHKKILIVDDEEGIREILKIDLESEGYEVTTAANGQQGLAALTKSPVDVILLDLMMPVMNGWEFAAALEKTKFADTPVLVITAFADQLGDIKHNALILKPFDLTLLQVLIKKWSDTGHRTT